MASLHLQLIGTPVRIDAPRGVLESCRQIFARFTVPAVESRAGLFFRIAATGGRYDVRLNRGGEQETAAFDTELEAFGFLYGRLLDIVTSRDPGLLCVHAASLARGGRGILLAGPSRHGKSTLALTLAARGFTLLSDEVGVVERDTLLLHPFPLAVGCRQGTYRLLGVEGLRQAGVRQVGHIDKLLLRPVGPDAEEERVLLDTVLFLEPGAGDRREHRRYRIVFDRWSDRLAASLAEVGGVIAVDPEPQAPALVMEVSRRAWIAPTVERMLAQHGVTALDVEDIDAPRPDFGADPELATMSTSRGVLRLLRHLRGFTAAEQMADSHSQGFGGLVAELAGSMKQVNFFQLTPGRLEAVVDKIESLIQP